MLELTRHSAIETTLRYYADIDADELAKGPWRDYTSGSEQLATASF